MVSAAQGQKAGQATAMKALTIQPGKLSLQQILQMQQAQKIQAAQQQKLVCRMRMLVLVTLGLCIHDSKITFTFQPLE